MNPAMDDLQFERLGPVRRMVKKVILNPAANYVPAGLVKALLRFGKSELAAANWKDPGGWRSMVISYNGKCRQIADKILVGGGTMPMALRNRRRLAGRIIAELIESSARQPVHVLGLGAGPGRIIMDAMLRAKNPSVATLVDISAEAFEFGRQAAIDEGLDGRVRFIQADVRDVGSMLENPPDLVKMIGICEYLSDEQLSSILSAVSGVMPAGSAIVMNSLSPEHGTDRFFRRVFGLHMLYRDGEQLQSLMSKYGFGHFTVQAEPLGVYHVIVGRKVKDN
ncbi:MAG: methyltransferase domain-containing protein [Planctomycetes bacterium]|jgi:SAM-dependent methyltransferase|nr:methyltransferase domain-containing protein [Planctomycetota bacterium]